MVVHVAFQAGRLAERRGATSVDLFDPDALTSVLPASSEVAIVSPVVLPEEVRACSGQVRRDAARNRATPLRVLEAMANVGE